MGGGTCLLQIISLVAIVESILPNCVRDTANNSSSSWHNWYASQFAMAVMDAVSSQAFMVSPSAPHYAVVYSVGNAVKMHTEFTYDRGFDNM